MKFFFFILLLFCICPFSSAHAAPLFYVGVRGHSVIGDGWDMPEQAVDGFYVFDQANQQELASVALLEPFTSTLWYGVAMNADGTRLYFGGLSGQIAVIDASSRELLDVIFLDARLNIHKIFFNVEEGFLYVYAKSANGQHDHLFQIDAATHQVMRQVDIGSGVLALGQVHAVSYDEEAEEFYCLHEAAAMAISVLRTDFTLLRTMPLNVPAHLTRANALIKKPDARALYASFSTPDNLASEILVINADQGNVSNRIAIDGNMSFLQLNHTGTRLLGLDYYTGYLAVINTANQQVAFDYPLQRELIGSLDVSPDDRVLLAGYTAGNGQNGYVAFDLRDAEILEDVPLHGQPWSIIFQPVPASNEADLRVTLRDNPDPVNVSGRLSYMLLVENVGPGRAENVVVTLTIPAAFSYAQAEAFRSSLPAVEANCRLQGQTITCRNFDIPAGQDFALVAFTVAPAQLDKNAAFFTASAAANSEDSLEINPANNAVTIRTTVNDPYWELRRSLQKILVKPTFKIDLPQQQFRPGR